MVRAQRIKGWVNIYAENGGKAIGPIHETKRGADKLACSTRLACIEIDCLEGDGL